MSDIKTQDSAYVDDQDSYGVKTQAVPKPAIELGVDTKGVFYDNIVNAGEESKVDISKIESFSQASQSRDTMYDLLDTMGEDPIISAILETYAEDATERNDQGKIVWCESSDEYVGKFVTYLLDSMNVDKNIYKWVYSLCKYGDVYLRLYRKSEFNDALFDDEEEESNSKKLNEVLENKEKDTESSILNEDVTLTVFSQNDKYVHYIEMVPNPAEIFELTKFGKSYAYIQAKVANSQAKTQDALLNTTYRYSFKKKDVNVYDATTFVHAALEDNSSRVPEEVQIFLPKDGEYLETDDTSLYYTVKRGQSLLYNSYKIWRELMLLENAMLLNRITKSSIIRIIGVEVGDMPKEQVGPHLMGIKNLVEQKAAVNVGSSMTEYTNPGAMENNIYVPTHDGIGSISMQSVGGDVSVKGLDDIDYFKNKFYGSLRVPKQYFGDTDDSAGFSGGESLAIISSRYAKMVKRIQNTILQALTDAVNLMLLDKGLDSYINKFELQMLPPTTSEEKDRRDNMSTRINLVNDTMNLLQDVPEGSARLKILKSLLSGVVNDSEVMSVLQEQIDALEESEASNTEMPEEGAEDLGLGDDFMSHSGMHSAGPTSDLNFDRPVDNSETTSFNPDDFTAIEQPSQGEQILPTPAELNAGDFTDNENTELQ